jgi:hypothetical protein
MFAIILAEQAFDLQADVLTCGRLARDQVGFAWDTTNWAQKAISIARL